MKSKKIAAFMAAVLAASSVTAYAKTLEFTIGSSDMYVCDYEITKNTLDCSPYTANDRTLVPVRVISENFGAAVDWDDATQRVDITLDGTKITLHIGSNIATVNGEEITLDVSPELSSSRTMVPLRFISEALGKRVEYVEASQQVIISDDGYAITVDDFGISVDDIKFLAVLNDKGSSKESLTEIFPEIKSSIVGSVALSNIAKEAGVTPAKEKSDNLADAFEKTKDQLYDAGVLTAPAVKIANYKLYGDEYISGMTVIDEETEKIYKDNYIYVKHILLKDFDSQTGEYFDDSKKAEIKNKAENIYEKIANGEDFDSMYEQYNEDDEAYFFPDGMIVNYEETIKEFADVAFNLKEGEISKVTESRFGYHIIKRLPLPELDEKVFADVKNGISGIKKNALTDEAVSNADIKYHMTDEEIINKIYR